MLVRLQQIALFVCFSFLLSVASAADLASHVNPFIGTVPGSGNTYPGAQVPFGMISWSPHTLHGCAAGYDYNNNRMTGFGLIHSSGVGCGATCELPFVPCTGTLKKSPVSTRKNYSSEYSHANEIAEPGYYSVKLSSWDINFETTVTTRSGIARIQFPATADANVIVNPTADANGLRDGGLTIDSDKQTISGWVKGGNFCQCEKNDYRVFFFARFDRPFKSFGIWNKTTKNESATSAEGKDWSGYVTFDCTADRTVAMKVGISFVSVENAKLNLDSEIPKWDFDAVKLAARADWNKRLGRIRIEGGTPEETTIFYTALYHSLMLPSIYEDVNGEYRGMDDKVHSVAAGHHFLSTFSGWDTYRTQAQLWGLLYPDMASDFCSSLLAMSRETLYKGGGGLPLWSLFNDETRIMNGYPASPYIASAYAFGAKDFDVPALQKVMVDSAKHQRWCGRNVNVTWDNLPEYKKFGYCPGDVSKTVEFSNADFAIAQMCKATGDEKNYKYFFKRSQKVFKLLNPEIGWLQRRDHEGKWMMPFDAYSGDGFTEGNSAHYTWTISHSLKKTFDLVGSTRSEARLDELTSKLARGYDYTSKYYEAGNEPCFSIMPAYNWLKKPWKAQEKTRTVLNECFKNKPNGIPGDDDSGAMSAWYIFMSLGLYPEILGVGGFAVLSPLFPKAVIELPNGKAITITAQNASRDAKYIQSMKIDNQPNSKLWLNLDQLTRGASLEFDMGKSPNKNWGTADADAPPSLEPK